MLRYSLSNGCVDKGRGMALGVLVVLSTLVYPAAAWHQEGHRRTAMEAVRLLPETVPAFFREGAATVGHCANDPDVFKNRGMPALEHAEHPEHFFDWELIQGETLPPKRHDFYALCVRKALAPYKVGTLPYSMLEGTQRLAMAFAEHRRWPDNPHIRTKCLVYAGQLAHYAADMCMPLHTTIHYDGRVGEDGVSPRSGIHLKVDALLDKIDTDGIAWNRGAVRPLDHDRVLEEIMDAMKSSFALVDEVYRLEPQFPGLREPIQSEEVRAFSRERFQAASEWTARLFLTAWTLSERIQLPDWLARETGAGNVEPAQGTPKAAQ